MVSSRNNRWWLLCSTLAILSATACADLTDSESSQDLLTAPAAADLAKQAKGSSAELVQYWKAPEELWVYDKRPELGVGVHPVVSDQSISQVKDANMRTIRVSLWWGWFTPGSEQERQWDEMIPRLRDQGIEVVGLISGHPSTYNYENRYTAYQDFAAFMEYVAKRYPSVRYWELFNEMDMGADIFGAGQSPDVPMLERGKNYGEMLKLVYPRLKQANPNVWVLTGGMMDTNDFPRGIYQAGARNYFDFMAIHTYGDQVLGEPFIDRAANVKRVMTEYGDDLKPLINTEFGMSGGITACVWMQYKGGLPHQQDPPQDDGTVFDDDQVKNWKDPIEYNLSYKTYWKLFPYQLHAGNDICKYEIDTYAKLPPGLVGDDYGFGIFRRDGTTPRPAYTWLKGRNVNGALTSTQSTNYDVKIPAPEKLRPIGYRWVIRGSEMTIKAVPVNSLVPTVVRFQ